MKKPDEYKEYIVEMLNKLDNSDETFLKQLIILIRNISKGKGDVSPLFLYSQSAFC